MRTQRACHKDFREKSDGMMSTLCQMHTVCEHASPKRHGMAGINKTTHTSEICSVPSATQFDFKVKRFTRTSYSPNNLRDKRLEMVKYLILADVEYFMRREK